MSTPVRSWLLSTKSAAIGGSIPATAAARRPHRERRRAPQTRRGHEAGRGPASRMSAFPALVTGLVWSGSLKAIEIGPRIVPYAIPTPTNPASAGTRPRATTGWLPPIGEDHSGTIPAGLVEQLPLELIKAYIADGLREPMVLAGAQRRKNCWNAASRFHNASCGAHLETMYIHGTSVFLRALSSRWRSMAVGLLLVAW